MKPGDEILIRAKLINVRESDNEVTVGFDSTTTAVVPLGAVDGHGAAPKCICGVAESEHHASLDGHAFAAAPSLHKEGLTVEQVRWLENLRDEARSVAASSGSANVAWAEYRALMADSVLAALHKEGAGGGPANQWPSCKWCKTDLVRWVQKAGQCPNCGAIDFMEAAATDAPKETPQDDNLRRHNEAYQRRLRKEASDVE